MRPRVRVALDARKLSRGRVGIAQYVLELARRLPALEPDWEFVLLAGSGFGTQKLPGGCRVVELGSPVPAGSKREKLYSPWWMDILVPRFMRKEGANLFHGTNFAVPRSGGFASVSTFHDLAFFKAPESYSKVYRGYIARRVRSALRNSAAVISVSEATKADMVESLGVDPMRVEVISHGVGTEYRVDVPSEQLAEVRREYDLPEKYVLHVGVVQRRKNLELLLRGCVRLMSEDLINSVVLAGSDGYGASSVRLTAKELGIGERVRFLGYVPQTRIPALYHLASALVMPSRYEGFGMPVLEAMACGIPVVASDVASLPEVAGGAALLFPPDDAGALERTLRHLLSDDTFARQMRTRGLRHVAGFSWDTSAAKHLAVYRRALRDTRTPA